MKSSKIIQSGPNPYLNRLAIKDPSHFFGRRKEVSRIFSRIGASRPQSIAIVGDRRIGKSSLLNYICTQSIRQQFLNNPEQYVFVFMDLQQRPTLSLNGFLTEWLQQIHNCLNTSSLTIEGSFDGVRKTLETLRQRQLKLISAFDEFDIVTSNTAFSADFFAFLRSLANNYEVAYITSSGRDLQELCHTDQIADSPFFNIFTNVYLRHFLPDEAITLITKPSLLTGISLEPYIKNILLLGGYFPFFLQIACSNYFEYLQENESINHQIIENIFYDETRSHFKYIWEHFDTDKRTVFKAISEKSNIPKELTHVLEDLKRTGYVLEDNETFRLFSYRFAEMTNQILSSNTNNTLVFSQNQNFQKNNDYLEDSLGENKPTITFSVPKQISHFQLQECIGRGGMGEVFLARDTELGRQVAIKILRYKYAKNKEIRLRFLREAQTASRLNHSCITTIYEIGQLDEIPYIVMEYVQGKTLSQKLKAEGVLQINEIVRLGIQAARALHEAHTSGIIHRDIKSSNLIINKKGNLKILDFGLAKPVLWHLHKNNSEELFSIPDITEPGILVGTVTYMSPEQAVGQNELTPLSDIFSLGVVLYEITTGKLPFDGNTYFKIIQAITNFDPTDILQIRSETPVALIKIINRALQKSPQNRFRSALEMADDLEKVF